MGQKVGSPLLLADSACFYFFHFEWVPGIVSIHTLGRRGGAAQTGQPPCVWLRHLLFAGANGPDSL